MAIQNARSNVTGRVPASLQDGQFAINQADGVLFSRNPDGTVKRNLLAKRYGVADAASSVRIFDTYIGIASLTASRVLALPPAASYPPGQPLTIADESGSCSPTVQVTVTAAGSDKINGNASYSMAQAYLGVIIFSDGASKWTAIALPASGASNALLYVAQSLTAAQQDQARANLSGAVPAAPTATSALTTLDIERDQFVTGTSTITAPAAAPGWRTGIVTNDNAMSGVVTLAVPSMHVLDGVTNGSTRLLPRQRARLRMVSAGTWRTDWVDRTPIVGAQTIASTIASIDFPLPAGYSFEVFINNLKVDTAGGSFGARLSFDNGATFRAGSTDYFAMVIGFPPANASGSAAMGYYASTSYFELLNVLGTSNYPSQIHGVLVPGAAALYPTFLVRAMSVDNASGTWNRSYANVCNVLGGANAIRFFPTTGNMTGGTITVRGVPL